MGYRLGDRTTRVLRFLFGLHDPRVVAELAGYGFTEADRDEGWSLLIDGWENEWFPIAEASLRRKFPKVYKLFFQNLRQVEGKEAVMSVTVFLKALRRAQRSFRALRGRRAEGGGAARSAWFD